MRRMWVCVVVVGGTVVAGARGQESLARVAEQVNQRVCKLYGSGGIRGLASFGSGVVVSPDGYVLTVASHLLDTQDLRVHLYDGTRYHARVVALEPELDIALVKLGGAKDKIEDLPYFDVLAAATRPVTEPGTSVLAFSNQYQIATRDEPVSVQHGVVAAYARLHGRSGIYEAAYKGNVYVLDAITNNPGAGGGALTTRKGELLGIIGKELRNELTNTWLNYAVPIGARVEVRQPDGKIVTVAITDLVTKKEQYRPLDVPKRGKDGGGGYHGIVLVPNPVDRTPPYVEEVVPHSPAARAGLKPDDLIVYVDGLPVISIDSLLDVLSRYRPGDELKLEVRRGDKLVTATLKLAEPVVKTPKKP